MKFRPEHYLEAAQEKIQDARRLHEDLKYPAAIYFAGVAVECLLRAYKTRKDPNFDSRHDLDLLKKASGITEFIPEKYKREFGAAFSEVWSRWKNDYRFASEKRLAAEFRRLGFDPGVKKGNLLKYNSIVAFENAFKLVTLGVQRWDLRKN